MEYFAANRIWIWHQAEILGMIRIGVDESDRHVVTVERLDGEIERTRWLGGLIIVAPCCMPRLPDESFCRYRERVSNTLKLMVHNGSFPSSFAFHVYPFNMTEMEFLPSTRIAPL